MYVLSMMRKIHHGQSKENQKTKIGGFTNFAEIRRKYAICMADLGGVDAPASFLQLNYKTTSLP